MKIVVDAQTHEILGAAVMCARALHTVIQRAMRTPPTVSEVIPTMLGELEPLSDGASAPEWRTEK